MTGLEIHWPDAAAERVRAARGRIETAGAALRARSLPQRIAAVARVIGDWTGPDSPWRRELAESFGAAGPFSPACVREGLESALRAWDPTAFETVAARELALVGGSHTLAPFEWTAVLAGGSLPMPTLLSALLPLVVGSPVLLRETAKDAVTGRLLARSLAARDVGLARAFESIAFDWEDEEALDALLEAPCVVATGSDETLRALSARLRVDQRFVAYGSRVSLAVVGASAALDVDAVAHALALDVARWDQTGCLSPVALYLVGFDAKARAEFARRCHLALDALGDTMPRGVLQPATRAALASERADARMRAASGRALVFEGRDSVVVLEDDAVARPVPLGRFLRIHPVATLDALPDALRALGAPLSSVALAGVPDDRLAPLVAHLSRLGGSRFVAPGALQTPRIDWPRDGLPLLMPLARFSQSDPIRA